MYRILIAEDELRIAAFIDKGLKKQGFETAIVTNGNDVLPRLQAENFHLLLLDIGLPGRDGWTVLTEIRRNRQTLPVVIVTARAGERDRQISLDLGANDHLPKPFRFNELLVSIQEQLGLQINS